MKANGMFVLSVPMSTIILLNNCFIGHEKLNMTKTRSFRRVSPLTINANFQKHFRKKSEHFQLNHIFKKKIICVLATL